MDHGGLDSVGFNLYTKPRQGEEGVRPHGQTKKLHRCVRGRETAIYSLPPPHLHTITRPERAIKVISERW